MRSTLNASYFVRAYLFPAPYIRCTWQLKGDIISSEWSSHRDHQARAPQSAGTMHQLHKCQRRLRDGGMLLCTPLDGRSARPRHGRHDLQHFRPNPRSSRAQDSQRAPADWTAGGPDLPQFQLRQDIAAPPASSTHGGAVAWTWAPWDILISKAGELCVKFSTTAKALRLFSWRWGRCLDSSWLSPSWSSIRSRIHVSRTASQASAFLRVLSQSCIRAALRHFPPWPALPAVLLACHCLALSWSSQQITAVRRRSPQQLVPCHN